MRLEELYEDGNSGIIHYTKTEQLERLRSKRREAYAGRTYIHSSRVIGERKADTGGTSSYSRRVIKARNRADTTGKTFIHSESNGEDWL